MTGAVKNLMVGMNVADGRKKKTEKKETHKKLVSISRIFFC